MERTWRSLRHETPWVKRSPIDYVHDHIRFSTQPLDEPDDPRDLDRLVPTHIEVPSGSRVAIDYTNPAEPSLSVRLQEMFGLSDTPRIAGGKVPLTIHLLSPARRPVQVTRDLASFWATGYKAVKAELKGRYPRHYWPDDPLVAEPTARVKPRPRR